VNQLGIDHKTFAREIKVSRATISDIYNGKHPAGGKVILNTLSRYEELSAEWLLRGDGQMIRNIEPGPVRIFEEPGSVYLTKQDLYNFHRLVEKVQELEVVVNEIRKSLKQ